MTTSNGESYDEHAQTPEEPPAVAATHDAANRPEPPRTGEPSVDAAIDQLERLEDVPVSEHVAVFDDAHRQLQDALADLDEE